MAVTSYPRSFPEIFTDLIAHLSTLLRKEGQLARTEVSENMSRIATGIWLVVLGAILVIPALVLLLEAAVAAISVYYELQPHISALIVGACVAVLGIILLAVGARRFRVRQLVPERTIHQLQQDASVARSQISHEGSP